MEHLRTHSSYILSIVALVLALFVSVAGILLGVISLVQSLKQKNAISKKAKIISIVAIVLGIAFVVLSIILTYKGFDFTSLTA